MAKAWHKQSKSLIQVQKLGTGLERTVREILGWKHGKVVYDRDHGYALQVDCVHPSPDKPQVIASVTYTKPDTRGHSNENKFQLKVGELALLKCSYPELRIVLVIGGTEESWLPYVLRAFEFFFDEVIFLWHKAGPGRLEEIRNNPGAVKANHSVFWESLRREWKAIQLEPNETVPPKGLVRYAIADELRKQKPRVHHPNLIKNEIARLCMHRSKINEGKEWDNFLDGDWAAIEMSRNFFNPVEASVEISLEHAGLEYQGGIAHDVPVPSLLHELGMTETSVSEDFILFSEKLKVPVYVQCKASGGGREQHGKNIQNRAKEQVARSLIYRCSTGRGGALVLKEKHFHWISILDGDWGVTKSNPLKYVHMLQLAGYDKIIGASELLTPSLNVKRKGNPLIDYLTDTLRCRKKRT